MIPSDLFKTNSTEELFFFGSFAESAELEKIPRIILDVNSSKESAFKTLLEEELNYSNPKQLAAFLETNKKLVTGSPPFKKKSLINLTDSHRGSNILYAAYRFTKFCKAVKQDDTYQQVYEQERLKAENFNREKISSRARHEFKKRVENHLNKDYIEKFEADIDYPEFKFNEDKFLEMADSANRFYSPKNNVYIKDRLGFYIDKYLKKIEEIDEKDYDEIPISSQKYSMPHTIKKFREETCPELSYKQVIQLTEIIKFKRKEKRLLLKDYPIESELL